MLGLRFAPQDADVVTVPVTCAASSPIDSAPVRLGDARKAFLSLNRPAEGQEWPDYFLAGAELSMQMDASGDAETCLRRGYCAVLGGWNTFGTLVPAAEGQRLYVLSAQMDALALFHDRVHGLNADASGMIALFAVADILRNHVLADPVNAAVSGAASHSRSCGAWRVACGV